MAARPTLALSAFAPLARGRLSQRRTEVGGRPIRRTRSPHGADDKAENLSQSHRSFTMANIIAVGNCLVRTKLILADGAGGEFDG